jgi:hypothetical protein
VRLALVRGLRSCKVASLSESWVQGCNNRPACHDASDGEHFFDTFAEDARFESLYDFPGWPMMIRGRAGLMGALSRRAPHAGPARRDSR